MRIPEGVSRFINELSVALGNGSIVAIGSQLPRTGLRRATLYAIGRPELYRGMMYGAAAGFGLSVGYGALTGTPLDFGRHIRTAMAFAPLGGGVGLYRIPDVSAVFDNNNITVGAIMKRVAGAWRARAAATGGATGA
jgi:hypothetical protein